MGTPLETLGVNLLKFRETLTGWSVPVPMAILSEAAYLNAERAET